MVGTWGSERKVAEAESLGHLVVHHQLQRVWAQACCLPCSPGDRTLLPVTDGPRGGGTSHSCGNPAVCPTQYCPRCRMGQP